MTASDQMRAMLDQLMGTSRDGEKPAHNCRFDDSRVCKSFLLECCPHDLLANTRMDMGECPKIHDIALRADFHAGQKLRDYYYDIDSMEHLEKFIIDCDRRTDVAKKRLKETQEELSDEAAAKVNVIHGFGEQIGTKLARAEELGAEGNVDESLKLMVEVEDLKRKKQAAENEYRNTMPASNYQQQKLRVCEVCSAYLGIHDNDRRLADHFGGKLHVGFITLRSKLAELKQNMAARMQKRDEERNERRRALDAASAPSRRSDSRKRSRTPDRRRGSRTPERKRSRTPERRRRTPDRKCSRTPDRNGGKRSRTPDKRRRSRTPERRRRSKERRSSKDKERRRSRSSDRRRRDDDSSRRKRRSRSRDRKSRSKSRSGRSDSKTSKSRRSRSCSPRRSGSKSESRRSSRHDDGSRGDRSRGDDKSKDQKKLAEPKISDDATAAGGDGSVGGCEDDGGRKAASNENGGGDEEKE
jgi:RNA-binding protein Luc7-like 2